MSITTNHMDAPLTPLTALLIETPDGDVLALVGDDEGASKPSAAAIIATVERLIATANWESETEQAHVAIMLEVFREAVKSTL